MGANYCQKVIYFHFSPIFALSVMLLQDNDLKLRALEPRDLPMMMKWENDTSLWHLSDTCAPFCEQALCRLIEARDMTIYQTSQMRLIIELHGRAIGAIDLFDFSPRNGRAGVGILIYEHSDRGHGYARRALALLIDYARQHLALHQLYADVHADNAASISLFKRCGFSHISLRKQWSRTGADSWSDVLLMQLLFI